MRNSSLALVAVICAVSAVPVAAQTISGRLVDDATGDGIKGAMVLMLAAEDQTVDQTATAADGSFALAVPEPAWYRLRAQRIGYAMATSPPLDLVRSTSLVVEFRLSAAPVPLPPITVIEREPAARRDLRLVRRGYYERKLRYGADGWSFGYFLEGKELDHSAFGVSELVRDLPGMRLSASGGRQMRLTCRSGGSPKIYLDGMRFWAGIDEIPFPASSIVALEVYSGMFGPAEYSGCAVVMWTGIRDWRRETHAAYIAYRALAKPYSVRRHLAVHHGAGCRPDRRRKTPRR